MTFFDGIFEINSHYNFSTNSKSIQKTSKPKDYEKN